MGLRQACSGCYVRAGHTLYDRRDCLSSSADKNANQVCYIICMNDFPMSLCLFHCRGQSGASTLGSSESLTADYFQATAFCCLTWAIWIIAKLSWRKVGRFCQFLWMLCCHLTNIFFLSKEADPHSAWPSNTWHLKGIFLLQFSSRNCWDAAAAT